MLECRHSLRREGCGGLASDFLFEIIRGLVRTALEQNWGLRGWRLEHEERDRHCFVEAFEYFDW